MDNHPLPQDIRIRKQSRVLHLAYGDGTVHELPFELLRVYSPSAEVRGHGMGPGVLQTGKRQVMLLNVEIVGNYALKLTFDDGHDSGLYTWRYLWDMGSKQDSFWQDYLKRLTEKGGSRD